MGISEAHDDLFRSVRELCDAAVGERSVFPRRAHNPILIDAGLIGPATKIPWWGGRKLKLEIV